MTTFDRFRARCRSVRDRMTHAALATQFVGYVVVGGVCAVINVLLFSLFFRLTSTWVAATAAFVASAAINYWLCVTFLFSRRTRSSTSLELAAYGALVAAVANI